VSLQKNKGDCDRAARIYRQLAGERGMDDAERWQHALFFAMSPQERCHFSLKTARSALFLFKRAANREKDLAVLPNIGAHFAFGEAMTIQRRTTRKRQRE